jgi:hypothetical protein
LAPCRVHVAISAFVRDADDDRGRALDAPGRLVEAVEQAGTAAGRARR